PQECAAQLAARGRSWAGPTARGGVAPGITDAQLIIERAWHASRQRSVTRWGRGRRDRRDGSKGSRRLRGGGPAWLGGRPSQQRIIREPALCIASASHRRQQGDKEIRRPGDKERRTSARLLGGLSKVSRSPCLLLWHLDLLHNPARLRFSTPYRPR